MSNTNIVLPIDKLQLIHFKGGELSVVNIVTGITNIAKTSQASPTYEFGCMLPRAHAEKLYETLWLLHLMNNADVIGEIIDLETADD